MVIHSNNKLYVEFFFILALVGSYVLLGRLSLLFAISPYYVTPIFLPAGIGIAALLLYGVRLLPSIFIGSLLLNLWVSTEQINLSYHGLSIAISIASGATLQAYVTWKLIHHVIGFPTTLSKDKDILLFLFLSGPVCCLINASIGITSLYYAGLVTYNNLINSWIVWWVGDSLGVIIVTPLMFIAFAKPKVLWRERLYVVAIPLVVMLSIVISLFNWINEWELERNQFEIHEISSDNVEKMKASFTSYVDAVASIERFYASSKKSTISRDEFKTFVQYTLKNKPGINGLSWNPVVNIEQRNHFEGLVKKEGFNEFNIVERDEAGLLINAKVRKNYVPVQYIEPMKGNEKAFGFDVASNPERGIALNNARDSGKALATSRITLVQENEKQAGFLLFYPVYKGSIISLEERRQNIQGFAVGVFRLGDITNAVIDEQVRKKVVVGIYDESDGIENHLYGPKSSSEYGIGLYSVTETILVAGRQWKIVFWPSPEYLANLNYWQAWLSLISGLFFTIILCAFLLSMTGKSNYLNAEVRKRTVEIEGNRLEILESNQALEERNKQLECSNQELDRYAFVASHDLKSPLNAIEQLAQWIGEDCKHILPKSSIEHLTLLNKRIKRMKGLLADLLIFSRINRGNFHNKKVNLVSMINKTLLCSDVPEPFSTELLNCNVDLEVFSIPLELALRNVISNAIKHHDKPSGTIIIEYTPIDEEHIISISDDGPGIPDELQDRAIEMFQTLQSRDEIEGSGLGLSIVKRAMERLCGNLRIISNARDGTKIELRWPKIKHLGVV